MKCINRVGIYLTRKKRINYQTSKLKLNLNAQFIMITI